MIRGVARRLAAISPAGFGGVLRRHWLFAVFVAGGLVLRVLVSVTYRPALIYIDSVAAYLRPNAFDPTGPNPLGYDFLLLRPLLAAGSLATVVTVQHLMGIAMAVTTYALLVRKGAWRWLAALATAPVLLDAYQVQIEHNIMSDPLFQALLVAGFAVLAWPERPGWRTAAAAGLLLGLSTLVRLVGEPTIFAALLYVLVVGGDWRRRLTLATAAIATFTAPLVAYAAYYHHWTGEFALSRESGRNLYGRVATFADCRGMTLAPYERDLCPIVPADYRPGPEYWKNDETSPLYHFTPPPGRTADQAARDFSMKIIRRQPVDFARVTLADAANALTWQHLDANPDAPIERWRFQTVFPTFPDLVTLDVISDLGHRFGGGSPVVVAPLASGLRAYQLQVGYTPGPVQGVAVLLGLGAAVGLTRRARRSALRPLAALYVTGGLLVLLAADMFEFTWRYQLPGLVLLPAAGALGLTALVAARRAPVPFPEPADRAALEEFRARYGDVRFPPVVVLIAAYNEAGPIGAVIDAIPPASCGRDLATLVVVDGASDATADVARAHGAYVCDVPVNRGQGAALRLGYHLARTCGAEIIVTTDADGQYDVGELPLLLEPLLAGEADFVTGSRRLGADESTDQVRRAGVRFFALVVSVLTGHRVTNTWFGFRAMRAEVTGAVTLAQPQYQSSELLVGVLSRGYRVLERPMTMHRRAKGSTKKGNNLVYGLRYARVVCSTWLRERGAKTIRSSTRNLTRNMAP